MATDQHSISRRAVIGALAAAPILPATGPAEDGARPGAFTRKSRSTSIPAIRWRRVLAEYRRLDAEWVAHPYASTKPGAPGYDRPEAEQEVLARRASQAFKVVLKTAAPDSAAFVVKLELVERDYGDVMDGQFVHLVNDARRLSGVA